jgi:hypothetical protein
METAAAMVADVRVVAWTSACRVAGGLVALEDAGPADAVAGRGTKSPGRGATRTPAPLWLGQVCPGAATKSAPENFLGQSTRASRRSVAGLVATA